MSGRVMLGALFGLLVLGAGLLSVWGGDAPSGTNRGSAAVDGEWSVDTAARAPDGVRVRVQVLNGSGRNGLARRATQQLRDYGYDVVDYASRGDSTRETEVQVTDASRAWGERVVKALGRGTVRQRDGNLGYVDVVVLLGRDWQPAPQPLRP